MADVYVKCKKCGYQETLNTRFIIKIIGGAATAFGFWGWVAYIFAGTGLALPICIAIVTGGVAIAAFSDEIAEWLSKKYDCPKCKSRKWKVIKE
jgi:ribosomal protein L37AE/L43A